MDLLPNPKALLVLTLLFVTLERLFPDRPSRLLRSGWKTDLLHLLVTHTLGAASTVALVLLLWRPVHALQWESGAAFLAAQPRWLTVVLLVLLADLLGYWWHRLEHTVPWLWRLHAVHHSSEQLDWLAGARRHPFGEALNKVVRFVPLVLLGFPPQVLGGGVAVLGLWAVLLHANVRLRLRWLQPVVATPDFHHWHHAREVHGAGHNFGGLFSFWDRLFGTWRLPEGRPAAYGADLPVPTDYLGQLRFPLLRQARSAGLAAVSGESRVTSSP